MDMSVLRCVSSFDRLWVITQMTIYKWMNSSSVSKNFIYLGYIFNSLILNNEFLKRRILKIMKFGKNYFILTIPVSSQCFKFLHTYNFSYFLSFSALLFYYFIFTDLLLKCIAMQKYCSVIITLKTISCLQI